MRLVSDNLELKVRLARLAPVRDVSRAPLSSDEEVTVVLHRTGALDQPIALIRRLHAAGMTMRGAHAAINRLAEFGWVACGVAKSEVLPALARELAAMNVELRRRLSAVEAAVDVVEMRAQHGLSQREYADLLGIDVRTLQNWEQGRNRPDPAAVSLMRIFAHAPEVFEEALSEPVA
jgi:DNA-binding transcriptional regulator YiaG